MGGDTPEQTAAATPPRWAPENIADIRNQVKKSMTAEIDGLMLPKGFRREGIRWVLKGTFFDVFLEFQKDRYGFSCYFNLGRRPRALGQEKIWRLNSLLLSVDMRNEYDSHYYVDMDGDTPRRREVLRQIAENGLPMLERLAGWKGLLVKTPSGF